MLATLLQSDEILIPMYTMGTGYSTVYPLTSQEILKYFSDGFLKNPMCQVTLLNLSTGICSNPRLIALYYRNRVGVGEGLGRVILNTKEGARERLGPGAGPPPIALFK